jgi:primosomal protein N' (replication factor Y)
VAHELREALGQEGFPIFRLDADSTGLAHRAQTLARCEAAPAGVLIGTQMVAKGHDFTDVRLGVVLDADATLRFPDFRAEERTFALVTQLAGRAGRRGTGSVLVQTMAPQARPIVLAAQHDSDRFLAGELERRRALGYPPYCTLIRVVCGALSAEAASAAAGAVRELIAPPGAKELGPPGAKELGPPGAKVLGPAPLFMLRGRARSQLVIKATERTLAIAAVGAAVEQTSGAKEHRGVSISVDVDPQ